MKQSITIRTSWIAVFVAGWLALAGALWAQEPDEPAAGAAGQDVQKGEPEASAAQADAEEWLLDEGGQRYKVERLEKKEGTFRRLGDDRIRTVWGPVIEIVDEDEKYFYYRVYHVEKPAAPVDTGPSMLEIQLVEASYAVSLAETEHLAFTPIAEGLPTSRQWRNRFELADMNGDGHLDLVHGAPRKPPGPPVIFLGDGKGGWKRWESFRLPAFPYDYGDVAVADFNGDGNLDLAYAMHLRGVVALVGDGKGVFELWNEGLDFAVAGQGAETPGFTSRALESADWNGDGRPDLIALGEGPHLLRGGKKMEGRQARGLVVYLNQGDGTWKRLDRPGDSQEVFGDGLEVVDLDGDGRLDVVTATHVQGRKDVINLGRPDGDWQPVDLDLMRTGAYSHSVTAADFDGDGRKDLAVGYLSYELETWRSGIDLFLARESGWERKPLAVQEGRSRVRGLAHGDVDGDGHLDLAGITEEGWVVLFTGDGKGGFKRVEAPTLHGPGGACKGYHVMLEDLDEDGMAEIVAAFAGEGEGLFNATECTGGGSIQAWDPRVETVAEQEPKGKS